MLTSQRKSHHQVMVAASGMNGEGGIRTPGPISETQHFQCCTIGRSVTSPSPSNQSRSILNCFRQRLGGHNREAYGDCRSRDIRVPPGPSHAGAADFSALRWATSALLASISATRSSRRRIALQPAFNCRQRGFFRNWGRSSPLALSDLTQSARASFAPCIWRSSVVRDNGMTRESL